MQLSDGGVLLIDKPIGLTSHDVVQKVRRKLRTKRVGHAGTLDPDASGLLVLCVDDATRVLEYLVASTKSYTGEVVFGSATDTDDATGTVIASASANGLTDDAVQAAVKDLTGAIEQVVPAYSAVHIDGKRAYELARAGETVDMPSRTVHIDAFEVGPLQFEGEVARASFSVTCSKGTYIRALCRDLGAKVYVPAHMGSLRREAAGSANVRSAVSLEHFLDSACPETFFLEPLSLLSEYHKIPVSRALLERLTNGQRIPVRDLHLADASLRLDETVMVTYESRLALVAQVEKLRGTLVLQPKKVFWKRG
ncbi:MULTISPECIES: tRNA pseudouridine(55) synthase TruB [Alicyclobacillus]|uniref:tRNA pseudouridine synthase B n=1 Tax=Alicyclobacillus acidoterrestris (strain ATCC 49025 / DSM 3922 / CIP 106132 / NCIMB 13137 / GD3B) TaxID=1356854 RepID=A0A9E6ZDR6_ALIAG|nr:MULTISPECIES: tRNA pseudouridine(55) synthase TruB [Alicyclobacillus]UNO47145.1 tRNA pseudouridine(55) synthase TruB [Alicyclobacillus acidoterrestris]